MPDPALPIERLRKFIDAMVSGTPEHGAFGRGFRGEYVPHPSVALDELLAHFRAVEAAHQQELQAKSTALEMCDARLRGMQDFLSGQPRDLPYRGSDGQTKESQLNFAWCLGYDCASESEMLKLFVGRADRTAALLEAAEARFSALQGMIDNDA
jgi:hypothetical protein